MGFDNQIWIRSKYDKKRHVKPVKKMSEFLNDDDDSNDFQSSKQPSFSETFQDLLDDEESDSA